MKLLAILPLLALLSGANTIAIDGRKSETKVAPIEAHSVTRASGMLADTSNGILLSDERSKRRILVRLPANLEAHAPVMSWITSWR